MAMETLARLVMLESEKEEETGMLKHDHYYSVISTPDHRVCILMTDTADTLQCSGKVN